VLWLHAWDYLTPAEEVMRALDDQVRLGKVLYLGVSDTPAWVVAQLQTLAAVRGWSPFTGLQIEYSLVQREATCCIDGSSNQCNQPGYPDTALTTTGHLLSTAMNKPTLQTVMNELENGCPISINIQWTGGGGHNPVTDGYDNRNTATPTIDIQDPWYGPSTQDFNSFPGSYNGGASWYESYFTK
jgi:diketogulonate reductase-like aldo/keto reductase